MKDIHMHNTSNTPSFNTYEDNNHQNKISLPKSDSITNNHWKRYS